MSFDIPYEEKLKDPRWQKLRHAVYEKAGWTCEDCHSAKNNLQAHHCIHFKDYEPWDYPFWLLRSVCDSCHKERQAKELEARTLLATILRFQDPDIVDHTLETLRKVVNGNPRVAAAKLAFRIYEAGEKDGVPWPWVRSPKQ